MTANILCSPPFWGFVLLRHLWFFSLVSACTPAVDWDLQNRPADYQPPPGVGGLSLTGPAAAIPGIQSTWIVRASDLVVGDRVALAWGGEQGPGPCPFTQQIGGHLCVDVTNPARPLTTTTATAHPTIPGLVEAVFEVSVPATSRPEIVLQAVKIDGLSSATSNTIAVTLDQGSPAQSCNAGAGGFGGGSGTAANPYLICAPNQLQTIDGRTNIHIRLVADLDLRLSPVENIELDNNTVFDGGGHTISNYFNELPLFERMRPGSAIRNLSLRNAVVQYAGADSGLLVGTAQQAEISDVHVDGALSARTSSNQGGIVGFAENSVLSRLSSHVDIYAEGSVGAAVGRMDGGSATEIVTSGRVHGNASVGGVVGFVRASTSGQPSVSACVSTAAVHGNATAGGVVGNMQAGSLTGSLFRGSVSGGNQVGGIVGVATSGTIQYNVATGSVRSVRLIVGGLVGFMNGSTPPQVLDNSFTGSIDGSSGFNGSDGDCTIAGAVGRIDAGTVERAVIAASAIRSRTNSFDLIGGQCSGTLDRTSDTYAVETVPGGELDDLVDVSGAPTLEASYPALDFVNDWALPTVNPLHPDGLTIPVPRIFCGEHGVVCP